MPAVLNNAIDWLSRPYGQGAIVGKPFAATPTPYRMNKVRDLLAKLGGACLDGGAHRASEYLTRGNSGSSASGVGSSRSVSRSG